jgi:hypothetical protein
MVNIQPSNLKVVSKYENSKPCEEIVTIKEHITLLLFVSATGSYLKPLAILPLVHLPPLSDDVINEFHFAGQPNGWIDGQIFKNFVETEFVNVINNKRLEMNKPDEKVLLILDGHSSRGALDAKMLLEQHNIYILLLPPHSSAITQPLDLSVNGDLKKHLASRFQLIDGESLPDKRNRLLYTVSRCLSRILNKDTILLGFERTGLWPYKPERALNSNMIKTTLKPAPTNEGKKRKRGPDISSGLVLYTK